MRKLIAITTALLALSAAGAQTKASREIPKDGTKVNLFFGEKRIPAVLNGSTTARELLARLPWSVRLTRYEVDFCGVIGADDFTLHRDEVRRGWKNGDICFTADGTYFSVLFIEHNVVRVRQLIIDFGGLKRNADAADVIQKLSDYRL
ncbi:MAG: hypothetical protein J1F14_06665 [Treponema sp.]|nr:hypothetical protein [Treponema sp.]